MIFPIGTRVQLEHNGIFDDQCRTGLVVGFGIEGAVNPELMYMILLDRGGYLAGAGFKLNDLQESDPDYLPAKDLPHMYVTHIVAHPSACRRI